MEKGAYSRGARICTLTLAIVLLYVLSSGPARIIWPVRDWRGGSMQLRANFGVVRPSSPWAEPAARLYAPLNWLARQSVFCRPLHAYWTFFDRENFYCEDFVGPWPATTYSRFGIAVRQAFGGGKE